MELRQLEYFQMVCKYLNITRAAELLHVSQPSITNSIKNLEDELGILLLNRSKKQIQITHEGEIFLQRANSILMQVNDIVTEMNDLKEKGFGILKIGIPPMIGTIFFPTILNKFNKLHPGINLSITENGSLKTQQLVLDGDIDLGMTILSEPNNLLKTLIILQSEILVCVSKNHPLSEKRKIAFDDIKKEPIIMLKEGFFHREKILTQFHKLGVVPNIILSSSQLKTIESLVERGSGISFLLKEVAVSNPDIVSLSLEEPLLIDIGLIWRKDRYLSNASKKFIDFIVN
jgi:DNA-binding transcriptional LysR family regulator